MTNEKKPLPAGVRRRRPKLAPLMVAAVIVWLLLDLSGNFLVAKTAGVEALSRREVSSAVALDGILIKEEALVRSPADGQIQFVPLDGQRLELGAPAARVVVAADDAGEIIQGIAAPEAGVFCTHIDGAEGLLAPDKLDVLDLAKIERIGEKKNQILAGARVGKGQPVFKIIDNLSPVYYYCTISSGELASELSARRKMEGIWENRPLTVRVHRLIDKGDRWEAFLLLSDYPDAILHYRKARIRLTTKKLEGLLVPRSAVVERESSPGVYLVVKKKARWTPVQIDGELDGKVAITGPDLKEGDRYVSTPRFVRDGRRVE